MGRYSDVYVLGVADTPWIACYTCAARGRTFYMVGAASALAHLEKEHVSVGDMVPADALERLRAEAKG
jgi:hypothetical protein